MMPTEPGMYRDIRGDEWLLDENKRWTHMARRLTDGTMRPVTDYPGTIGSDTLESLAREPGVDVLPLTRIEVPDYPPGRD